MGMTFRSISLEFLLHYRSDRLLNLVVVHRLFFVVDCKIKVLLIYFFNLHERL